MDPTTLRSSLVLFASLLLLACASDGGALDPGPDPISETDAGTDDAPSSPSYDDDAIKSVLDLPATPFDYEPDLPAHFLSTAVTGMINTPSDNPITDEGATLGRVLFFDVALSANRTVACASCHASDEGYSDTERLSVGFEGGLTGRNSMGLVNVRYYQRGAMFWDERAASVEDQVLRPIQDATEMGMTLDALVARLEGTSHYPPLFELAFGDPAITEERISFALAQFVRAHVSSSSRYDEGLAAANGQVLATFANFTEDENRGKLLFFGAPQDGGVACATCHVSNPPPGAPGVQGNLAIFQMPAPRNNGLDADTSDDQGVGAITGRAADMGLFKSPSLRNVALSAPYMHDGSIATLRGVIEHYNTGVQDHPNLDPILRDGPGGPPRQLGLSDEDMDALVAFLETLTDHGFVTDERFSNPFLP